MRVCQDFSLLSGEDDRQLLQRISQDKYINVYGYSEKGLTFLGSKQVELKQKLRDSLEGILRNSKISVDRQQSLKTQKPDSKQVTLETQGVFVPLQPDKLLLYPLIERCRYQLQRDIQQQLSSQTMKITRQVFWRLLLIASLEQARSFTFYSDAANMIEQKRLTLKHSNWPVLTPEFPIPHLWLGFFQPIKTPVCQDTAAIFVFSANDSSLREHSPVLRDLSPQEWKVLYDNVYEPERDLLSLNVVNTHGKIVWSMSLPTTVEEARKHSDQRGLGPVCK